MLETLHNVMFQGKSLQTENCRLALVATISVSVQQTSLFFKKHWKFLVCTKRGWSLGVKTLDVNDIQIFGQSQVQNGTTSIMNSHCAYSDWMV